MRLTVRTNLAMRALMFCAVNAGQKVQKRQIADCCNASEAHLGVVINKLAHARLIETIRGRNGGILLARSPEEISVGQVFRLFEAGTPFAECFSEEDNHCPIAHTCRLRDALMAALEAFYLSLDQLTLRDLIADNRQLAHVLELARPGPMACAG